MKSRGGETFAAQRYAISGKQVRYHRNNKREIYIYV